jgi:hypothetical protein
MILVNIRYEAISHVKTMIFFFILLCSRIFHPSFNACTSWILIGVQGHPKLELLSILHLIASFFFPYT